MQKGKSTLKASTYNKKEQIGLAISREVGNSELLEQLDIVVDSLFQVPQQE